MHDPTLSLEFWRQIKTVVEALLDVSSAKRPDRLKEFCGDAPGFTNQVERLLAYDDVPSFLDVPLRTVEEGLDQVQDHAIRLEAGQLVSGRYRVVNLLGRGGMGEVYLAHDPHLDRHVAIKLLPVHLAADATARERLRQEALAVAALDHPFICKVFEVAEEGESVFIVMEYVRGETLLARMRASRLSFSEGMRIAVEIAEAIEEAHSNNLIHSDLNPSNIMLTTHGHVKVMDFGLAKKAPSGEYERSMLPGAPLRATDVIVGTPGYMSPEQLVGGPLDQRSDMFSFGLVLCELLAGNHPFKRASQTEGMIAVLREAPDVSIASSSELPAGLMVLIRRLLAKSPQERYPSMGEVRADMARLAAQGLAEPGKEGTPHIALIERDQERERLRDSLDAALAGRGSLILIGGEPGIGKTHLTRALLADAARRGCFSMVGRCYEMEGAPPYIPFIETLEYCSRVAPRELFRHSIGDAAPEIAKIMPDLRRIYPDIPPPIELPAEQQRRFLFNAYRQFVERLTRVTPIVAIFEDLQWADEPTLLLLQHLAQTVATVPMLIIGTYRDVELDATRPFAGVLENLMREKTATRLSLRRLSPVGVQGMLAALSGQTPPASLVKIVFEETEGNPFFAEEVFRHLAEEGKLFDDQGAWRSGLRAGDLQVPQSVRLAIGRRLERLGDEARRVLTTAAVIGRSFSLRLLEDFECARPDAALDAVEQAERAHLVVAERNGREIRYRFVHELVRQTLAEALSMPRRQRLHASLAGAIEKIYSANLESEASVLAYHLYQAGAAADLDKTIAYLTMAARLASSAAAHEEALAHLDNALSLIEPNVQPDVRPGVEPRRDLAAAELHAARAVVLCSVSRLAEAIEAYERAIASFIDAKDFSRAAETSFHLGSIYLWNADGHRGFLTADRAIQLIGTQPTPLRYRLLLFKALSLSIRGDIEASFSSLAETQQIEAELADSPADGFADMCKAHIHYAAAQLERADACGRRAVACFRAMGNLWGEAEVFEPISAGIWLGRPTEIESLLRDSRRQAERVGHQNAIWAYKGASAAMLMIRGDLEGAEGAARDAREFGLAVSGRWTYLDNLLLGAIAHYRGRFDDAVRWIRQGIEFEPLTYQSGLLDGALFWTLAAMGDGLSGDALAAARPHLPVLGRPLSLGNCGCLTFVVEGLARLGLLAETAALQPDAERLVAEGPLCVHTHHLFRTTAGIAAASAQNWTRAEEHHRTGIYQADSAPYAVAQPITRYWYADMLLSRGMAGDRSSALSSLHEALTLFESMGMAWHARQTSERIASQGSSF